MPRIERCKTICNNAKTIHLNAIMQNLSVGCNYAKTFQWDAIMQNENGMLCSYEETLWCASSWSHWSLVPYTAVIKKCAY